MVKREGTSRVRLTRRSYLKGVGVLAASGTGAVAGCTGSTSNGPAGDGQGDSGGSGQDGSGFEPADYFDISSMGVYDGLGDPIELYRVDAEPLGGKMHPAPRHLGDNPFEPEHGRWYDSAEADDSTLNDPQKIKMVELWHNTQWEPDPGDFPDGLSTWMWRASNEDGVEGWYVSTYVLAAGVHESGNIPVAFDSLGSLGITAYAETSDGTVEKRSGVMNLDRWPNGKVNRSSPTTMSIILRSLSAPCQSQNWRSTSRETPSGTWSGCMGRAAGIRSSSSKSLRPLVVLRDEPPV